MNHTIRDMGQRYVRCDCMWVGTITAVEYAEFSTSESENRLLDLHGAHAQAHKDAGR